jgi:hypothetical protein
MPPSTDLFSAKKLFWLTSIGTIALLGAAYLMVFGDPDPAQTAGANAFSRSAIGHAGLAELLSHLGIPTYISQAHSLEKARGDVLLVIAEPADNDAGHHLLQQVQTTSTVLVILPKRTGRPDPRHPLWIASSGLISESAVNNVLHDLDSTAHINRSSGNLQMSAASAGDLTALNAPQLIFSPSLTPVISRPDSQGGGMLVGKTQLGSAQVWIVSDPDLIANHGLSKGGNAAIAIDIIRRALPVGGTIVIDEVEHGFAQEVNLLQGLLHLPILIASVAFVLTFILLLLAGMFRFGAVRDADMTLPAGKSTLIANAAALLAAEDRRLALTDRYLLIVFAELARRLGISRPLDDVALIAWLDRQARHRGLETTASIILTAAKGRKSTTALMRQLQHWTREMTHGPTGRTRHHTGNQPTHQG